MNGLTMKYSEYMDYVSNMDAPIMPSQLPKGKYDFKGMIAYAKEKGVSVPELSAEEQQFFIKSRMEGIS